MNEWSEKKNFPRPGREIFLPLALAHVPHIVHLVDRNPFSPTYGCFDREYWHYRTLDFPCGMSQELVLPLALIYRNPYPGNKYHALERVRELACAAMRFAMKGSHRDGTCDDYFPYERAMGAMVFSTYAAAESYRILEMQDPELVEFFVKRCRHLERHNESGKLSNHQALAGLAAITVHQITGDDWLRKLAQDRVGLALSWQHPREGWFQEYEGADPGYHTCTIDFLAKYYQKSGEDSLIDPLKKAVDFAAYFMHPDGSYGGEYGSRNTYHYYPHGFEVLAPFTEKAIQLNDAFLLGVKEGRHYAMDDDRLFGHLVYNWLQAYGDFHPRGAEPLWNGGSFTRWFPHAGLVCCKRRRYYAVSNLKKGGVTKVYSSEGCVGSDTGIVGELDNGSVIVTHLMDDRHRVQGDEAAEEFRVNGVFSLRSWKLASPLKLVCFRIINLTLGRFFPNLIRHLLQKILITGKKRTPYPFLRKIRYGEDAVHISDEFPHPIPVRRLAAGSDATSIYVAASNVYQESVLKCPWAHASPQLLEKVRKGGGVWVRTIAVQSFSGEEPVAAKGEKAGKAVASPESPESEGV